MAPQNQNALTLIAQGVINALFAGKRIRLAPIVRQVVDHGSYRFRIDLDNSPVAVINVVVEPDEFFAEAVRRALLRRFAIIRQKPRLYEN